MKVPDKTGIFWHMLKTIQRVSGTPYSTLFCPPDGDRALKKAHCKRGWSHFNLQFAPVSCSLDKNVSRRLKTACIVWPKSDFIILCPILHYLVRVFPHTSKLGAGFRVIWCKVGSAAPFAPLQALFVTFRISAAPQTSLKASLSPWKADSRARLYYTLRMIHSILH